VPLRLETLGTLIFVNPDADAPPLAEVAAGITDSLAEDGIDLDTLALRLPPRLRSRGQGRS
jgi:hypothetical protein